MTVTFFVPGSFPATTGAIVFDTMLAEHLRSLGYGVTIVPVAGAHPMPDAAARASAAEVWRAHQPLSPADTVVIDGFCLYAFDGLEQHLGAAGAIGMVHHPMSLEPQLPQAERDAFMAIEQRILPLLARIVVPSEAIRTRVTAALALPPAMVEVATPGIPDAARSAGSGGRRCHLLAIGSLIPRKGHETVLRALAGLADLDWTLTICGDSDIDPGHATALGALVEDCRFGRPRGFCRRLFAISAGIPLAGGGYLRLRQLFRGVWHGGRRSGTPRATPGHHQWCCRHRGDPFGWQRDRRTRGSCAAVKGAQTSHLQRAAAAGLGGSRVAIGSCFSHMDRPSKALRSPFQDRISTRVQQLQHSGRGDTRRGRSDACATAAGTSARPAR